MRLIKICYIYVGGLKKCALRLGFHTSYQKYPQRMNHILDRIIIRGHKVIPINIEPCLGSVHSPYISYGLNACVSLLESLRTRVDIFLADYLEAGVLAYICKKMRGSPFVFDYRDNYSELAEHGPTSQYVLRDRYICHLEKIIPKVADQVITVSEDLRRRCLSFGVDDKKIVTIPHGADTKMFNPLVDEKEIRKKFNLSKPTIIFIGKIEPYYHLDILIKAFSIVVKEEPLSKLLLVGNGRSLNDLKDLSKKLKISDSVIFAGFQPHESLPKILKVADGAVFTHYSGLAIYEYMACGKPIVKPSAKSGEILEHLNSGFLIKERTPEEFARGIIKVVTDKHLSIKMGKNARKLAVKNYDWELIVDRFLDTLQNLICNIR